MTEADTTSKIYDKLIEISNGVGKLQADMDTVKADIRDNYTTSEEADRRADDKLEAYYQQAKDRQDSIRDSMIELIRKHDTRIEALENWRKLTETKAGQTVMYWLCRVRDWAIWAVVVAALTYGAMTVKELWRRMHTLPPEKPAIVLPVATGEA